MGAHYDRIGAGYAAVRQPDARLAAMITRALGAAVTVVNVGAGAGSYEPADRTVVSVEPSAVMLAQPQSPTYSRWAGSEGIAAVYGPAE